MFEKINALDLRYQELARKICEPDIINDTELYRNIMKNIALLSQ